MRDDWVQAALKRGIGLHSRSLGSSNSDDGRVSKVRSMTTYWGVLGQGGWGVHIGSCELWIDSLRCKIFEDDGGPERVSERKKLVLEMVSLELIHYLLVEFSDLARLPVMCRSELEGRARRATCFERGQYPFPRCYWAAAFHLALARGESGKSPIDLRPASGSLLNAI